MVRKIPYGVRFPGRSYEYRSGWPKDTFDSSQGFRSGDCYSQFGDVLMVISVLENIADPYGTAVAERINEHDESSRQHFIEATSVHHYSDVCSLAVVSSESDLI